MIRAPPIAMLSPKNFKSGAISSSVWLRIDCAPESHRFSAKKIFHVPNVTIKGGNLMRVTRNPFSIPARMPPTNPIRMASGAGTPSVIASCPIMTDIKTMIAPTERSIPAVRITRLCAAARMPMIETCCTISDRLNGEKNFGPASAPKMMIEMTRTITGTIVGLPCRKCCVASRKFRFLWSNCATALSLASSVCSYSCFVRDVRAGSLIASSRLGREHGLRKIMRNSSSNAPPVLMTGLDRVGADQV